MIASFMDAHPQRSGKLRNPRIVTVEPATSNRRS